MRLINLTAHNISIYESALADGPTLIIKPSGTVARVSTINDPVDELLVDDNDDMTLVRGRNVYVVETTYLDIVGLPDNPTKSPNVGYIVSGIVLDAAKRLGRTDVYAPGELVRDANGNPRGCVGLRQ
jgi:hypothetical protein